MMLLLSFWLMSMWVVVFDIRKDFFVIMLCCRF